MSGPCFGGTFGSGGRFNPSALACGGGFIGSGGLVDPDAVPLPVDLAWDEASRLVLGFGGGGNFGTGTPDGIDNRALALACSAAISALASASLKLLTSNGALLALANVFGFGVVLALTFGSALFFGVFGSSTSSPPNNRPLLSCHWLSSAHSVSQLPSSAHSSCHSPASASP